MSGKPKQRKAISKKVRFEVFKRDSFTCQYCGKSSPDVVLHVDHITPVAGGGNNDIMNLVTSCQDCNQGKGAKELSDQSAIEKQKRQLNELNEKRLQLEMMLEWREALSNLNEIQVDQVGKVVFKGSGFSFSEHGRGKIGRLIKKYGLDEVLTCADISRSQYEEFEDEKITGDSIEKIINYIGRIASSRVRQKENPELAKLYYIRGIVRNRMYCNDWQCLDLLKDVFSAGVPLEELEEIAKTSRNWTEWKNNMTEAVL